ncbi:hypothetical protein GE061_017141 [Apolygus lucorum]|uniref:Uncharacterized protein n=1 Tax=Apolygus lucorum TaxID=248454 RepID=A0A6A4IXS7_APOLU|nr:hypothetical protein GE061_017141 [Apolygus lucorum]
MVLLIVATVSDCDRKSSRWKTGDKKVKRRKFRIDLKGEPKTTLSPDYKSGEDETKSDEAPCTCLCPKNGIQIESPSSTPRAVKSYDYDQEISYEEPSDRHKIPRSELKHGYRLYPVSHDTHIKYINPETGCVCKCNKEHIISSSEEVHPTTERNGS